MDLSIIIPVYNNSSYIEASLSRLKSWLTSSKYQIEVIIVNDGSTDNTLKIINKDKDNIPNLNIVSYEQNKGKGYAIKQGLINSKGNFILFTDTDLSYGLDVIIEMFEKIRNNPTISLLVGSRNVLSRNNAGYGILRNISHLLFLYYVKIVILPKAIDTQCGIKIMTKEFASIAIKKLTINRFAFDVELFVITLANNLNFTEFPVLLKNHETSSLKILKDTFNMAKDILKIKKNYKSGYYKISTITH